MDRQGKESFVAELQERLGRAPVLYLTDFTGLDVKSITTLRRSLKASGAEYLVVKNRLAMRAFTDLDLPDISEVLEGPTGLVFGYDDAVTPAKTLADFARENGDKPVFKLGIIEKEIVRPEQIRRIASLPPREQLLAQLAGAFEAPMAALAGALEAKLQETAGLLAALAAEREAGG